MDEFLTPKQLEAKRLGESIDDIARQLDESDNISDEDSKGLKNLRNSKEARLYGMDKDINVVKESGSSKQVREEKAAEKLKKDQELAMEEAKMAQEYEAANQEAQPEIPANEMARILGVMNHQNPEPEFEAATIEDEKLRKYQELLAAIKGQ